MRVNRLTADIGEEGRAPSATTHVLRGYYGRADAGVDPGAAVGDGVRRLREQNLHARTVQLKLRDSGFRTITRARTLDQPTSIDSEVFTAIRDLFHANWDKGSVRLLGVYTSHFDEESEQLSLGGKSSHDKWNQALSAADRMRERFGEHTISLATGMKARFRERIQENPADLPGKKKQP